MSFAKTREIALWIINYEIWIILVFTGLAFLSTQLLWLSVLTGILLCFLRWVGKGYIFLRTKVDGAILILVLMTAVTIWVTGELETTKIQVFRLLNGVILFYSIVNWADSGTRLRLLTFGLILVSLLLSFYATFSVEWEPEKIPIIPTVLYDKFVLLVGDTVHRNVMGGTLLLILPISTAILMFTRKQISLKEYNGILVSALIVLAILVLTQSRGALVAFILTAIILVSFRWKWIQVVLLSSIVLGTIYLGFYGYQKAIVQLTQDGLLDEFPGRLETWSRAGYMIQDFPFTGIGMGTFGTVVEQLYPFILQEPRSVPHAHNLYLQIAVDLGIPGLIAWTGILLKVISTSWQVYRTGLSQEDKWLTGIGVGFLGSQLAMMIHGVFDAVTWGMVRPAPIVWAIWGLVVAYGIQIFSERIEVKRDLI